MKTPWNKNIYLTDIMDRCCPEQLPVTEDKALTVRIQARVLSQIGEERPRKGKRILRTALLAAAAATLLITAAFAAAEYFMNRETVEEKVSGYWQQIDENGDILFHQEITAPDAGMVLSFSGPADAPKRPEFRAFWLPSAASDGYTDEEGWTYYLADSGQGERLPYVISAPVIHSGKPQYVLSGKPTVVWEERWGDWDVLAITSDYSQCSSRWFYENDTANYVFLFDASRGYLISVSGTSDMDTLLHIARELEIRESDEAVREQDGFTATFGLLDLGRG